MENREEASLNPDPDVVAEIDRLAAAAKAAPGDTVAMAALWRAVYGLERWIFIARGTHDEPSPYALSFDEGPMVLAFTTAERAQEAGRRNGLSEEESSLLLSVPLPGAIEWAASLAGTGITGILFDYPAPGYFAPLGNLIPMRDHMARNPVGPPAGPSTAGSSPAGPSSAAASGSAAMASGPAADAAPAAERPDASGAPASAPVVRSVVLLRDAPAGMGAVVGSLMPDAGSRIGDAPLPRLTVTVNDVPVTFEISTAPIVARQLDYAVSQSPLRDLVQEAVAQHTAALVLSAASDGDVFRASELLAHVTAHYAQEPGGLAVWLPDADHATTAVMYAGEVAQRPAQVWFHTMAARMDESTSLAHTIGLGHLGGEEVQLRAAGLTPADAHRALRGAVATILEKRRFPAAGDTIELGGATFSLVPAVSVIGVGDVLDAVPASAVSPAESPQRDEPGRPARRGWFGRGSR
ncbi:hypothetical protein [Microbacterium sp. SORGH_AS_0888]|uniref:hypothetical protein n=1 Tax=Microbacterium sp. SORGH_AS_0888 TaxID=3041791 RepID=UPI00278523F1|nr:hypothetical protein [Microbacterium sp. SORGH_AS_0888]MDQ1130279.1 phosphotransferase system HPr-like phosphotransfer protein [Microbacterium sp. SORGH_AS_0888]